MLRQEVRATDLVARWGGEEFLIVLLGADAAFAEGIVHRVREALSRRRIAVSDDVFIEVTASFGIADTSSPSASMAELLVMADRAMYRAKLAGRDCVRIAEAVDSVPALS